MKRITITGLDDRVVERLRKMAHDHERSLEAEVRMVLKREAWGKTKAEFLKGLDRIAAATRGVPQTDSTELVREDRDNR